MPPETTLPDDDHPGDRRTKKRSRPERVRAATAALPPGAARDRAGVVVTCAAVRAQLGIFGHHVHVALGVAAYMLVRHCGAVLAKHRRSRGRHLLPLLAASREVGESWSASQLWGDYTSRKDEMTTAIAGNKAAAHPILESRWVRRQGRLDTLNAVFIRRAIKPMVLYRIRRLRSVAARAGAGGLNACVFN